MGESSTTTFAGLVFLIVMVLLTFTLPRKNAYVPLLITTFLIPLGQSVVLFGVNLFFFRILILAGMARVLCRGETAQFRAMPIDKLFLLWALVSVLFGSLSEPSFGLLINRAGDAFDAVGSYIFLRCVIRDRDDVVRSIQVFLILAIPFACIMLSERLTGRNPLAFFGGVPVFSDVREGEVRAQAAFRHPILAGTAGAWLFVLAVTMGVLDRRRRWFALLAGFCAGIIVVCSNASGPLLGLIAGIGGLVFWLFRSYMSAARWGAVIGLFLLALVMKAPVWYLSARIAQITGGSGWYRAYLIDLWLRHFNEWWLFGTLDTSHWAAYQAIGLNPKTGGVDVANHYVAEALDGGMLKLALFLAVVVLSFKVVGKAVASAETNRTSEGLLAWSLGSVIFVHCVSFLSVAYFDQSIVFWSWSLVAVVSLSQCAVLDRAQIPQPDTPIASHWISASRSCRR